MIFTADLAAFLASRGVTAPVYTTEEDETEETAMPDRIVILTQTGGMSDLREGVFEQPSVQVRCRGLQLNPADAQALGDQVDRALMDATFPVTIGGRHVPRIQRIGGPPAVLGRDESRRHMTSANYLLDIQH